MSYEWSQFVPFFGLGFLLGLGWRLVLAALHYVLRAPSIAMGE